MSEQLTMTIPPRSLLYADRLPPVKPSGKAANDDEADTREIGARQAEACLEKTRQTQDDWPERAWETLLWFVAFRAGKSPWTGEEATAHIVAMCGQPHDNRATGSLFSRAAKAGLIRRSAETYQREHGHGTISLKWETV
jgi:hypothetical protein